MYEITKLPSAIDIGFTGEHQFRTVEIDMRKWMRIMPNGIPSIIHIRPGETINDAYIANTTFENGILRWVITQEDLGGIEGVGTMQVWFEESYNNTLDKRGKSAFAATQVYGAINDPNELIPPARSMLMHLVADIITLPSGSDASVELEYDQYGHYNLHFKIPRGPKGDQGIQGDPAPEELVLPAVEAYLADTITNPDSPPLDRSLTSTNAAAPADLVGRIKSRVVESTESGVDLDIADSSGNVVMRLKDGHVQTKEFDSRDVPIIDDTSGDGDTGKVWSADKLSGELGILEPDADSDDVGKALIVKTVSNGKVVEYEFGEAGGDINVDVVQTTKTGVDLDITDHLGNVIMRLKNGHVLTKEFDSEEVSGRVEVLEPNATSGDIGKSLIVKTVSDGKVTEYEFGVAGGGGNGYVDVVKTTKTGVDLDVIDRLGNVILRLKNGHIQTKQFNSEELIDDAAGDGDTGKVWSADKTHNETASIRNDLKKTRSRMEFGAHNGAEYYAPECTVPAYRIAGQQGWEWAWIAGIDFSTDGTMYVIHDDTVDRTTDGTGYLNQMSDAEINALNIDQTGPGYNLSDFDPSELKIPTLEQVIQQCVRYGMKMVLRLSLFPNGKDTTANAKKWDDLMELIHGYGIQPEDVSCYLDTGTKAITCRTLFGDNVEISTHLGKNATAADFVTWFSDRNITGRKAAIIHYNNVNLAAVKLLHSNGIRVYAYGTTNETVVSNCATMGVDIFQNEKTHKIE